MEKEYPMTEETAAPFIPISGKGPMPNISSGSNMKFTTTPAIWNAIGASIFPVPCMIFWIAICTMFGTWKNAQMNMYWRHRS